MSGVAPGALRLTVDSGQIDLGTANVRAGQLVYGRVVEQNHTGVVLDVLGQRVEVSMTQDLEIGTSVPLRVIDVSNGEIEAQVIESSNTAQSQASIPQSVLGEPTGTAADVVRSVRRLVDAAATRIFGGATPRAATPKVLDLAPDAILRVSVRGDQPQNRLVSFEPEALAVSSALSSASSEELLAAQAALERLDVPATPLTIAAALPEANDPARLVSVLARTSAMLAEQTPEGRLNTLRTLAEFLSQISPQDESIDGQISSFVDQITSGGERKLFELLTALAQRGESGAAQRLLYTARATERATSLTNDIKTQLLAVSNAQSEDSPLVAMLTEALEVVTAAQLTSLNAAKVNPGAIAFVLPIVSGRATLAAQVVVQRDTPEGRNRPLDAENFKISFVLDTKRLGTVRIDIESVARALRVTVEAQTTHAAEQLRSGLESLRARLDTRGYRTVAITAQVVRRPPYRAEPTEEEQRTYVQSLRANGYDAGGSIHLDTRA